MLKIIPMNFFISSTLTFSQLFQVDLLCNGREALITLSAYSFVFFTKFSTNFSVKIKLKINIWSTFKPGVSMNGKFLIVGGSSIQLSSLSLKATPSGARGYDWSLSGAWLGMGGLIAIRYLWLLLPIQSLRSKSFTMASINS